MIKKDFLIKIILAVIAFGWTQFSFAVPKENILLRITIGLPALIFELLLNFNQRANLILFGLIIYIFTILIIYILIYWIYKKLIRIFFNNS